MTEKRSSRLKSRKNKKAYESRLRRIARFAIRGLTQDEIAEVESISQQAVSEYLVEIRNRNLVSFEGKLKDWDKNRERLAAEINAKYDELEREAWSVATGDGSSKVAALKEIREINKERIEIFQRLGLIYEEPSRGVVAENYDQLIDQIQKRKKERSNPERN